MNVLSINFSTFFVCKLVLASLRFIMMDFYKILTLFFYLYFSSYRSFVMYRYLHNPGDKFEASMLIQYIFCYIIYKKRPILLDKIYNKIIKKINAFVESKLIPYLCINYSYG